MMLIFVVNGDTMFRHPHSDSLETQKLLRRIQSGDRTAAGELLERHRAGLRRAVELRFDVRLRSRLDASDVMQETEAEAFRRLSDFVERRPMPFALWLRRTAQQRIVDHRRKHVRAARRTVCREQPLPDRSSMMLAAPFITKTSPPGHRAAQREYERLVAKAVAELGELDREILLMRNVEGLTSGTRTRIRASGDCRMTAFPIGIVLPAGTPNADFAAIVSAFQSAVAAEPPKIVFPIDGADLPTVIALAPRPSATTTLIAVELRLSGPAVDYDVADRMMTILFADGSIVSQNWGTLFVTGTSGNDIINFDREGNGGAVAAAIGDGPVGTFLPTWRIMAYGLGGDDDITVAGSIPNSAWLDGGIGNDRLRGGGGDDFLYGYDGDDLLVGGGGRDFLVGHAGADRIVGNSDDDILVSGLYFRNDWAIEMIMREWTSGDTYENRTAHLSGAAGGQNNGVFLLAEGYSANVQDDGATDSVYPSRERRLRAMPMGWHECFLRRRNPDA